MPATDGSLTCFDCCDYTCELWETRPGAVDPGEWTHVTCSGDSNSKEGRVYIDSQLVTTDKSNTNASCMSTTDWVWTIGANNDGARPFEGRIDEVEVFTKALHPDEVRRIHDAGEKGKCKQTPSRDRADISVEESASDITPAVGDSFVFAIDVFEDGAT